jgi:hypothetical protein
MVSKIFDRIIDKMGTWIDLDYQWTSKSIRICSYKNLVIIVAMLV